MGAFIRVVASLTCLSVLLTAATAVGQTQRYTWKDMDCRQSRIVTWSGLKCRTTNVATSEGDIGAFRQWTAFGTNRDGYYVHMFLWEAENTFSYLSADQTTADFLKWMFEHGKTIAQVSAVSRYNDADYVTFRDDKNGRNCVGFRRLGNPTRGGYDSVTGGILCAPGGKRIEAGDIPIFIDNVRLQAAAD